MPRFLTDARPPHLHNCTVAEFYREEFRRHRRCLEAQRECYSECAVAEVEAALQKVMAELETLCRQKNCNQVVSGLLKKFDVLTGLSAWSDPKTLH
jgi:hypothetical protein